MIKNLKGFLLLVALTFVLALAACQEKSNTSSNGDNSNGNSGETISLRVAAGLSGQHVWWHSFAEPWAKRVEELTDGQVEFTLFAGGELVSVAQEPEALKNGTADIALMVPFYSENLFPASAITSLPALYLDESINVKAFMDLMESDVKLSDNKTFYESHFADNGYFVLAGHAGPSYTISTTGHQFESVADVKGISARAPNLLFEYLSTNLGINSVSMNIVEAFDALSRGAFEGIYHYPADWTAAGFQDILTYTVEDLFLGTSNGVFAMTQEKWDSLPANVQDAMLQARDEILELPTEEWIKRQEDVKKYNIENAGGEFVSFNDLPKEVQDHINAGAVQTWYDYIDYLEKNNYPGKEIAILWRDILIKNGAKVYDELMNLEDY